MKFTCDRCQKRFTTTDEPVPGRVYRVPCRCGNTIVVQRPAAEPSAPAPAELSRRGAPPPLPAPAPDVTAKLPRPPAAAAALGSPGVAIADDPFARAEPRPDLGVLLACASEEVTPTILARRDPDAPLERSSAYRPEPTVDPFVNALRRTRTRALALGGATGAAVGALCAAALALVVLRPWSAVGAAPAPSGDVAVALLASHHGPARPVVAGRKAPIRAAGPSVAVAAPPRAARAPAPPSPAGPTAAVRERGAVVPAVLESERAPERVDAAEEPASGSERREALDARDATDAPAERPETAAEDPPAPEAAPAEAPAVPDEPATATAAAEAAGDPPAPARDP